ncbi:50S ribosomal protein L10 [bacterium]|nr:50S ribosomal protein L10 [bacterium]
MIKADKKKLVKNLVDELGSINNYYFADFTGINAGDVTRLRRELRSNKARMKVVKNRLLAQAFTELKVEIPKKDMLRGSTAIIYSLDDILVPARKIAEFAEDDVPVKFKGAFVEGRFYAAEEVIKLSKIPSKEVLLGQLVGLFESVKSALVGVLQAKLQEFTLVLDSLRTKKEEQ